MRSKYKRSLHAMITNYSMCIQARRRACARCTIAQGPQNRGASQPIGSYGINQKKGANHARTADCSSSPLPRFWLARRAASTAPPEAILIEESPYQAAPCCSSRPCARLVISLIHLIAWCPQSVAIFSDLSALASWLAELLRWYVISRRCLSLLFFVHIQVWS